MDVDEGRVVALGTQTGTAATGGASFKAPFAAIVEARGGLIIGDDRLASHAEALAAAGVEE